MLGSEVGFTGEPIVLSHGLAVAFNQRGAQSVVCGLASMEPKDTSLEKARSTKPVEHVISYRPVFHNQKSFVYSEASLADVTVITSYSREAKSEVVSGLMFKYSSARSVVIGEARCEQHSIQKDASHRFTLITAYYESYMHGRRLSGIRFDLENRQAFMFGITDGFSKEEMFVQDVTPQKSEPNQ